jgi:D-alanyl-D-alanine carboxypeptidase
MKKRTKRWFTIEVIGLIALLFWLMSGHFAKKEKEIPTKLVSINQPEQRQEENWQKADLSDWKLILVNQEHPIPEDYEVEVAEIENGYQVDKRILTDLSSMLADARKQGLKPWICSSYRSSAEQTKLFNNKVNQYKQKGYSEQKAYQEASVWVAIPKTSEHEIGLSVDIVSKSYQLLDKNQEKTAEQKWLMENCHRYGFVMRYPMEKKQITKIEYEPWHYRYVGIENAKRMKDMGVCLEEYIESIIKK